MMDQPTPTETVGDLLKQWRTARSISQMDLALEANVSTRHLSFVETGRAHPSDDLLLRLAEVMRLPHRHTNALLVAAGYAPRYRAWSIEQDESGMIRAALEHTLSHHEPYPALVTGRAYDLVMANDAYGRVVSWLTGDPATLQRYTNVYRLLFAADGLRPYIVGWASMREVLLKRLHEESIAYQSEALATLHADCAAQAHETNGTPIQGPFDPNFPTITLTLRKGPTTLRLFSTIATFGTAIDVTVHELRIETLFPADEATHEALQRLAEPNGTV